MTVLPDTSVWIDYFRGVAPVADDFDRLLGREPIVYCGPILAELVAGAGADQRDTVAHALGGLGFVELGYREWREAGDLMNALRNTGAAVPLMDVLIAVAARRAEAVLWTRDEDFRRISEVAPDLRVRTA